MFLRYLGRHLTRRTHGTVVRNAQRNLATRTWAQHTSLTRTSWSPPTLLAPHHHNQRRRFTSQQQRNNNSNSNNNSKGESDFEAKARQAAKSTKTLVVMSIPMIVITLAAVVIYSELWVIQPQDKAEAAKKVQAIAEQKKRAPVWRDAYAYIDVNEGQQQFDRGPHTKRLILQLSDCNTPAEFVKYATASVHTDVDVLQVSLQVSGDTDDTVVFAAAPTRLDLNENTVEQPAKLVIASSRRPPGGACYASGRIVFGDTVITPNTAQLSVVEVGKLKKRA